MNKTRGRERKQKDGLQDREQIRVYLKNYQ